MENNNIPSNDVPSAVKLIRTTIFEMWFGIELNSPIPIGELSKFPSFIFAENPNVNYGWH